MFMQEMIDFVQRFKGVDMSSVSLEDAKDIVAQSAGRMGFTHLQGVVMIKHIFG